LAGSRRATGAAGATGLTLIGQRGLHPQGTLDHFIESTFNDPTLAEAYKIAALDARSRMPAG
jgi:NAD(P) transhydrogenase